MLSPTARATTSRPSQKAKEKTVSDIKSDLTTEKKQDNIKLEDNAYIEKVKELKLNNPGISIRVVAIDKMMINDDEVGIDMNQDIKKYIDSNIPKNLYNKYETIKEKIEERGK